MNGQALLPLIGILIVIFMIGLWAGKSVRSSDTFLQEYFLGNRSMGGFLLAMTMTATYGSASSFIGGPGVAYTQGLGWVLLAMSQVATGYFVLMILGKKFAIVTRKYEAVTMVDYLKERYQSKWVVWMASLSIIIFLFSAMAAQWIGGARLIESLTGMPYLASLFIFAISVLIYVVIGGFRSVAVTDAVQGSIMFIGTLILLIATVIAGGGIPNIIADLQAENQNLITPFGADGEVTPADVSSFWWLCVTSCILFGSSEHYVYRNVNLAHCDSDCRRGHTKYNRRFTSRESELDYSIWGGWRFNTGICIILLDSCWSRCRCFTTNCF